MDTLEARIRRLEALEDIKRLKARYWYACDHKDVAQVRDCFVDGPIEIDYAGTTGRLGHRDELYEVFQKIACRPNIVELHHGGPPRIELLDDDHARGIWSLSYHVIDTEKRTSNLVGGYYHDEYARIEGEWKIRKTRFEVVSAIGYRWKDGPLSVLYASSTIPSMK